MLLKPVNKSDSNSIKEAKIEEEEKREGGKKVSKESRAKLIAQ